MVRSLGGFDLTTGARERTARNVIEALGRILDEQERLRCFGCHTTRFTATDPAPSKEEMGIRCERCHGPGLEHVRAAQSGSLADRKIFHPGRLDSFQQAEVCGVCHGRPPAETDFPAIRAVEQNPLTVRFSSQRLVLSRCFNESEQGLKCTLCHDPHGNVAETAQPYDAACLSCHTSGARRRAHVCRVGRENCASCHMPKERVMLHSDFTDHWIRKARERVR